MILFTYYLNKSDKRKNVTRTKIFEIKADNIEIADAAFETTFPGIILLKRPDIGCTIQKLN